MGQAGSNLPTVRLARKRIKQLIGEFFTAPNLGVAVVCEANHGSMTLDAPLGRLTDWILPLVSSAAGTIVPAGAMLIC